MKIFTNYLLNINWIKTIYFNFKYFSFLTAIHFPFLIYHRTDLYKMNGKIILNVSPKFGLVKIGPHGLGTQDVKYSRTMWEVNGTLTINGEAIIGRGSRISIGENATITLGNGFKITGRSTIISQKSITFGKDCLLSWDILIMDTDFHHIIDFNNKFINSPRPITIGNHVWIGCRNTILKGVTLPNDVIVAAGSVLTKSIHESNCIIGGSNKNMMILKKGINWKA